MKVQFGKRGGLIEIYQKGLEYNLLEKDGDVLKGLHPPVRCKDFLTDAYWSEQTGKPVAIYGFKWKPGVKALAAKKQMIGLYYQGEDLSGQDKSLQNFLNQWEDLLGLPNSKAELADDKKHIVVHFDREWTTQPIRVSLFTLLLRIGLGYDGSDLKKFMERVKEKGNAFGRNDGNYTKTAWPKIERLLKEKELPWKQKFEDFDAYNIHDNSGIVNYSGK